MVYQNQSNINSLHMEGCYVTVLYNAKEILFKQNTSLEELENYWNLAISKNIIDNNFILQEPQKLIDLMGLPLKYRDPSTLGMTGHFPADTPLEENTYRILYLFRPANKFHHFVQGDSKEAILAGNGFDPIKPFSYTIQDPKTIVESIRLYDIIG